MEFVKKLPLLLSLVMLVSSSIVQEDVLPAHLDVKLVPAQLHVLHVLKMDSQLYLEPVDLFVVME